MIDLHTLEEQLKSAGCNFRFWGRSELKELRNILMPGETIVYCVNGRYSGGFALLCVTDRRLLLVDHKPMYLSLEDIRFDMISEIDYDYRLLEATAKIFTPNKSLVFTSWSQHKLRELVNYTQQRIMEIRQYYLGQQFQQDNTRKAETVQPSFLQNLAIATGANTLQQAGSLSIDSGFKRPMHNPYAQIPLISRRWSRKRF